MSFFAYSPLRCFLDTISHCEQKSSIVSKKATPRACAIPSPVLDNVQRWHPSSCNADLATANHLSKEYQDTFSHHKGHKSISGHHFCCALDFCQWMFLSFASACLCGQVRKFPPQIGEDRNKFHFRAEKKPVTSLAVMGYCVPPLPPKCIPSRGNKRVVS